MKRSILFCCACALAALSPLPVRAAVRGLSVDVWTNRGAGGVYQVGEEIQVKVRPSDDAYVLVYEIDADGYVHVLFPYDRSDGALEARKTYDIGRDREDAALTVEGPVGQGYIVALSSLDPFEALPWYLRAADPQAEELGYDNQPANDEDGVTSEGRIVGDPFVAMERIRRRVLSDPEDGRSFGSSYADYYVGHEVRYPRYLCNDCHRPGQWQWWDGFDPYYTHCSVFDFRVNYRWYWGPTSWFGNVPYFVYVCRDDAPSRYRGAGRRNWSSWDGWSRWQSMWGGSLRRFKSPPPPGYQPPGKYDRNFRLPMSRELPPGFLGTTPRDRIERRGVPLGRPIGDGRGTSGLGGQIRRERIQGRDPVSRPGSRDDSAPRRGIERPMNPRPGYEGRRDRGVRPTPDPGQGRQGIDRGRYGPARNPDAGSPPPDRRPAREPERQAPPPPPPPPPVDRGDRPPRPDPPRMSDRPAQNSDDAGGGGRQHR